MVSLAHSLRVRGALLALRGTTIQHGCSAFSVSMQTNQPSDWVFDDGGLYDTIVSICNSAQSNDAMHRPLCGLLHAPSFHVHGAIVACHPLHSIRPIERFFAVVDDNANDTKSKHETVAMGNHYAVPAICIDTSGTIARGTPAILRGLRGLGTKATCTCCVYHPIYSWMSWMSSRIVL